MKKAVVVLWSMLLFFGETNADIYLQQKQTIPSTGKTVERTLWIAKDAVRVQSPNLTKIIRYEDNVMYTLVAGKKKAIKLSLDMAARMLKQSASLMLPTDSQSVREMDRQHDWFFQPKASAIGYSTILTAMWSVTNLEQAVKVATMTGGKQVAEKKAIANGFVVMKKPRGMIQELWVFQNAKGKKLAAKCSGPATALKTLMAICGSLKVE